jgi:chromate transport protein ChrA
METMKPAGDILSIGVVLATLASWLPSAAALLTIVWTLIRIYETRTVQRLLGKAESS